MRRSIGESNQGLISLLLVIKVQNFHHHTSQQRKKNSIESLKNSHGTMESNPNEIDNSAVDCFSTLFVATNHNRSYEEIFEGTTFQQLSNDQLHGLGIPYSEEGVKTALTMMHPSKAPGPDDFHVGFYQKY